MDNWWDEERVLDMQYRLHSEEHLNFIPNCSFCKVERKAEVCHCGQPISEIPEINFNYGLCEHCRNVRCDAYPGACRDNFDGRAYPDDYAHSWEL